MRIGWEKWWRRWGSEVTMLSQHGTFMQAQKVKSDDEAKQAELFEMSE